MRKGRATPKRASLENDQKERTQPPTSAATVNRQPPPSLTHSNVESYRADGKAKRTTPNPLHKPTRTREEMDSTTAQPPLTELDLIENPESRLACVIIVDTSRSMSGEPIAEVNAGIRRLNQEIAKDELTLSRTEICIIAFNSEWSVIQHFGEELDYDRSELAAYGGTKMAAPIQAGLDLIENRKASYRSHGIPYYRPILMLITDGRPEHDTVEAVENAAKRIREQEDNRHLTFFAIGTAQADMEMLNNLSNSPAKKLDGTKFVELFQWLSNSITAISQSTIGERVQLPSTDPWSEY